MVKVAIIGLGKMGMSHCAILGAHPDVELVGMCDPDSLLQSAFKKLTKIACYTDYKKMIEETKPDAVYVVTPTKLHEEMVVYALEHGCHVFCEKPFSLTEKDGQLMVETAKKYGKVNQVGYHNRFIGTFVEAKRLLDAGVIGKPFHFMGEAYGPVVLKRKGGTWRSDKKAGGGCVMDYAAHVLNLINYVCGSPIVKVAGTSMPSIFSAEVDDAVYSTLTLENGLKGQLSVCWSDDTVRKMTTSLKIEGDGGKIFVDATTLKVYVKEENKEERLEKGWNEKHIPELAPIVFFNLRGEEYSEETDQFIKCIEANKMSDRNSFEDAYKTDKIINALMKDAQNG